MAVPIGHVSRRLGPASRLVPFLAAGELRHARPRALRRRPDPRLRPRREGPEDVEVARQHRRAAGRDQGFRRRHPAPVGGGRPTTRTICASARRSSRPSSRPTASCATRSAGCSARWRISSEADKVAFDEMPELERFVLHRLAELDGEMREAYGDLRLQAGRRAAELVHDHATCRRSISTSARTRSIAIRSRARCARAR